MNIKQQMPHFCHILDKMQNISNSSNWLWPRRSPVRVRSTTPFFCQFSGDLSSKSSLRLFFAILADSIKIMPSQTENATFLPHGILIDSRLEKNQNIFNNTFVFIRLARKRTLLFYRLVTAYVLQKILGVAVVRRLCQSELSYP